MAGGEIERLLGVDERDDRHLRRVACLLDAAHPPLLLEERLGAPVLVHGGQALHPHLDPPLLLLEVGVELLDELLRRRLLGVAERGLAGGLGAPAEAADLLERHVGDDPARLGLDRARGDARVGGDDALVVLAEARGRLPEHDEVREELEPDLARRLLVAAQQRRHLVALGELLEGGVVEHAVPGLLEPRHDLVLDDRLRRGLAEVLLGNEDDERELGDERFELVLHLARLDPRRDPHAVAPVGELALLEHVHRLDDPPALRADELVEERLVAGDRLGVDLDARHLLQRAPVRVDQRLVARLRQVSAEDRAEALRLAHVEVALLAARGALRAGGPEGRRQEHSGHGCQPDAAHRRRVDHVSASAP